MAIQFDPNALRMFSGVNFGDDDAIANLGGENNLVQKDKLGSFFWKPFRSRETEKRNNAVRTGRCRRGVSGGRDRRLRRKTSPEVRHAGFAGRSATPA
jgi:hypothetical protein